MVHALQRQMIIWTLGLAALLGVTVLVFMLEPPASAAKISYSQAYRRAKKIGERKDRRPAAPGAEAVAISTQKSAPDPRRPASAESATPNASTTAPSASSSSLQTQAAALSLKMVDYKFPCPILKPGVALPPPAPVHFAHDVAQIRLTGTSCREGEITKSEIQNRSNGFWATVFSTGKSAFITDYISLSAGENKIFITHQLKDMAPEYIELVFVREAQNE